MRRVALLAAVLTAWVASPAAGWVELPPRPVAGDGVADCLRAADPGQVVLLGPGHNPSAIDLFTVGSSAIGSGPTTTFGRLDACPEIAGAAGVRPVLAALVGGPRSAASSMRVADAGSAPVTLGAETGFDPVPSVAVAPSGAAVVAWAETVPGSQPAVAHVLAAVRRTAGAPFGPPLTLGASLPFGLQPSVGIDAAGQATVVWISTNPSGPPSMLNVASTTDGGRFVTRQLASASGEQAALAVSPAGRTLVVDSGSDSILAYERAAGASAFTPVPVPASGSPDEVAVAVADNGGAVIAYRVDSSFSNVGSAVSTFALMRRPGGDAFGREHVLEGSPADGNFSNIVFGPSITTSSSPLPDDLGAQIAATLDASGDVLVTWVDPGSRSSAASAHVARGTIAGGLGHPARFGSPCRAANAAQPLTLADGTLGAAWTDNARVTSHNRGDTPLAGGLLHVLVPGQAATYPEGPPPGVSAQLIGSLALHGGQPLRLRVRCHRGPCIVRAAAAAYPLDRLSDSAPLVDGSIDLPRGRAGMLTLDPAAGDTLARPHNAPAQISLLACTPTGTRTAHLALRLRLHRLALLPAPRIVDLVARRRGDKIDVTWRTSIPARNTTFEVVARPVDLPHLVYAQIGGHGRSRFSITLHSSPSVREHSVSVQVSTGDHPYNSPVTARIR